MFIPVHYSTKAMNNTEVDLFQTPSSAISANPPSGTVCHWFHAGSSTVPDHGVQTACKGCGEGNAPSHFLWYITSYRSWERKNRGKLLEAENWNGPGNGVITFPCQQITRCPWVRAEVFPILRAGDVALPGVNFVSEHKECEPPEYCTFCFVETLDSCLGNT